MQQKNNDYPFLSGGGEMGELMRSKDWSETSLGDPADWPQSLRTTLSIILNSRFPMFLWWGPELLCFYNDAYRPSLGNEGKHPSILGMKAEEAWSEIWEVIHPLIGRVIDHGESTWSEDQLIPIFRNGKIEDVYWTFSYSPVNDESGSVAGVLVTCFETTEKTLAAKNLQESEERFRTMAEGSDMLIGVENELGNATYFNKAWLNFTGRSLNQLTESGWVDLMHPEDKDKHVQAYIEARKEQKAFSSEFRIKNEEGEYRWFLSNSQLRLLSDGQFAGYIGSSVDITNRKKVEEEHIRFKFMADNASDPFILMHKDGSFEYLNKAALEKWGYTAEEAKSLKVADIDPMYRYDIFSTIFDKGQKEDLPLLETLHRKKDGTLYPVEIKMGGVSIHGEEYIFAIARDIRDRRTAEKKVKLSERNLRLMIHQAPLAIAIFRGPEYVVEIANSHALELWGHQNEKMIGVPIFEAMPELLDQGIKEVLDDVYKTGHRFEAKELPVRLHRHGGLKTVYINFSYEPLYDTEGNINGIMPIGFDVTDQVEARKKIEATTEKLNIVIEASELGTWEYDLPSNGITYSDRYLEIFGHKSGSKIPHRSFLGQIFPEDLEVRKKAFEEAAKKGSLQYMARIIWPDESIHWIDVKGKVFYNEEGEPNRMIGTLRDVTEERHTQQKLAEREQKFRLLADSMPHHVWTTTPEGKLNYFNQFVFDYTGLTQEDIDRNGWSQVVHPDDREMNRKQWDKSIETGQEYIFEHRFKRFDGEYRWQLSRAIPQRDENGDIRMWVGSSTDIQDQKMFQHELEKQVSQRTAELAEKNLDLERMNKELQSFAYVSSHDLQEPLRKIQAFSSRILDKEIGNLSEKGQDYLVRMQNAAKRMQTLIEDLLAYSRTSTGDQKFEVLPLEFVAKEVAKDLNEELEQNNAKIEIEAPCVVRIIHFQFRQMLTNLISNSLKFTRPGVSPLIKITSRQGKGEILNADRLVHGTFYCHIKIEDNGIGFDKQHSEIIFELFQRLYGRSEYKGTGIGLAIVKKIVENHNGIIVAEGEKNKGAIFNIYLPAYREN